MEHLFVRWEDPTTGAKLNIEATSPGLNCHSDEYYMTWPKPIPAAILSGGWMLRSMTPNEEVAMFYKIRANCFQDWCDYRNMLDMAYHANHLTSQTHPLYRHYHALASLLYRQYILGDIQYGIDKKLGQVIALENGQRRETYPLEAACVRYAHEDFNRLKAIHQTRRDKRVDLACQEVFAEMAADPGWLEAGSIHPKD